MERDIKHGIGQALDLFSQTHSHRRVFYASMQLSGHIQWLFLRSP